MSDFETARMKSIMDLFEHNNRMTVEEITEIHVPSVLFPRKVDLQEALNQCITYGKLMLNGIGQYVKTEIN